MREPEVVKQVAQSETVFVSQGVRCAATVYRVAGVVEGSAPVVVMANGVTLTRRDGLPALARRFAAAGAVVVTIDFRSWGDSDGEPRDWCSVRRMRDDLRAAVGFARGLPGVDADRVVLWGFSLGGGISLQLAAEDPRIAGVVAVAPVADGLASMAAPAPIGLVLKMLGRGIAELVTRRPVRMRVAGRGGDDAIFLEPEFLDGFLAATAGRPWRNEVSTSWLVTIAAFRPVRKVGRISAPVLYQLGDQDAARGASAAVGAAERTAEAEPVSYPSHHFAVFSAEHLGAYCDDAIDFLRRRVGLGTEVMGSQIPPRCDPV